MWRRVLDALTFSNAGALANADALRAARRADDERVDRLVAALAAHEDRHTSHRGRPVARAA